MADAGFAVTHLYGLTETYGPAVVNEWHSVWDALDGGKRAAQKARQGVRYAALEGLTVMDPATMQETPADGETIGEVMFRGNIVMKGYLKNSQATEEALAGGWFHSGDLGVMHPDGYIQLKDRSKDIIISGGENISSIEVEDALYKHPAVASCGVVARPDEKWGETPVAYIELRPGATRDRGRDHRALPHAACPLQMPEDGDLCGNPQDLDRQDPEIQAAGVGPPAWRQAGVVDRETGGWRETYLRLRSPATYGRNKANSKRAVEQSRLAGSGNEDRAQSQDKGATKCRALHGISSRLPSSTRSAAWRSASIWRCRRIIARCRSMPTPWWRAG